MSKLNKLAIRFGLGAIKAVGFKMMENVVEERNKNGQFKDVYDLAERIDPRSVNKKSIEALSKAGAFDKINKNRRQIFESFDILSSYSAQKNDEANSDQMSLFGGFEQKKPSLRNVEEWTKSEKLQKEFEAFGFFLNEHPIDDYLLELKQRGVIFSEKIEKDELEDGSLIKISGVVASSKHRSSAKGRFAYLTVSDPFGIFEAMIFDEALINSARDILVDGSLIVMECLIRRDDGGIRILVREISKLEDFIKNVKARKEPFEDIKIIKQSNQRKTNDYPKEKAKEKEVAIEQPKKLKNNLAEVEIFIKERESIFSIKSFLSQLGAQDDDKKTTKVKIVVIDGGKITKIELPKNYALDQIDVDRLRKIEKIFDVEYKSWLQICFS